MVAGGGGGGWRMAVCDEATCVARAMCVARERIVRVAPTVKERRGCTRARARKNKLALLSTPKDASLRGKATLAAERRRSLYKIRDVASRA